MSPGSRRSSAGPCSQSARLAANLGEGDPERRFEEAVAGLRQLEMPFELGVALVEQGERLLEQQREAQATTALGEASAIFTRLRAERWLERARRAEAGAGRSLAVAR